MYSHHSEKSNGNKNNKKTFSIKMKEDVGTSKPKKHAKQGWEANIRPEKLNTPLPYKPT